MLGFPAHSSVSGRRITMTTGGASSHWRMLARGLATPRVSAALGSGIGGIGLAAMSSVLLLAACVPGDSVRRGAAAIADSLAVEASALEGAIFGSACGDSVSARQVEAFPASRLDMLGFDWRVRCVRRITQRPGTLRIDEIEEMVAWRDGTGSDTLTDAVFVAVSHGSPSDTADGRGLWPLAAVLAALEELNLDSVARDMVLTVGAVPEWDILDISAPDDTASVALDSAYSSVIEASASAGPSPPLARPRRPGVVIGLIPRSDLPVMSHDSRRRLLADGSLFGHAGWHMPESVAASTSGDMLALALADGVTADDSAALYDMTGVVVEGLKTADEWPGREPPSPELRFGWQTINWLLGILLPILFIGIGMWALLAESRTNLCNAKRALQHTYAEVASHLLWHRRAGVRLKRRIARAKRRGRRAAARVQRLERIVAADGSARKALRMRKANRLSEAKRRREELAGNVRKLETDRLAARREEEAAKDALLEFARNPKHVREWDSGASEDAGGAAGSRDANADGGREDDEIERLVGATCWRRMWLVWVSPFLELAGTPRIWHPRDRSARFVGRMSRLASRLLCWRRYHDKVHDIRKVDARELIGGVWAGVWGAMTNRKGVVAFCVGIVSVIVAVALPVPEALAAGLVIIAYIACSGRERGRPMLWGSTVVAMLGLTTIEFTALKGELDDVFDSQRVTVMQLVIVAMLFMGQAFDNRANRSRRKRGTDREETAESKERAAEKTGDDPSEGFAKRVRLAGARFTRFEKLERCLVLGVILLYMVICLQFVRPAIRWDGLQPLGWEVSGDALGIVAVAGTVVLLPVFSFWCAWRATKPRRTKRSNGNKGNPDG